MAKYAQLRDGTWGVRVEGKPVVGATVQVVTKAGTVKTETIKRILFTGPDKYTGGTTSLCAIVPRSDSGGGSRSRRGRDSGAGEAPAVPGYSSWCTNRPGCGCYDCAS